MRRISLVLALVAACGGGDDGDSQLPVPPAQNDPAFSVTGVRNWYLVGNDLTPGNDTVELSVTAPAGVAEVEAWIDGDGPHALSGSGTFTGSVDIATLAAGDHELLLAADGAATAFAAFNVRRSHPYYAVVSNDWDDANNTDNSLLLQEQLHEGHPEMVMTHFVGPYTFTDSTVSNERRQLLINWVKGMRDDYGDEIGLHIHPYCNFIDTTSVTCRTEPSTVYANGDNTGYTVMCAAYTVEEFTTLLEAADQLFMDAGLGKPTSFRAGGWTADLSTLQALENAGYVADTSANNWARMEEWMGVQNGVLYDWNSTNWATIGDTSQPYYPAEDDLLGPGSPAIAVLEVPDNGILVDYVTGEEMIEIFGANWSGGPLTEPKAYSIGYHPTNIDLNLKTRLDEALTHVDGYLASQDAGPVVYETLSNLVQVWQPPE
jgi:hypothetical protein